MVYPEGVQPPAAAPEPDDDRTSITSQNQISNLVGRMEGQQPGDPDEDDYVATQIASGELDKLRAMHALQQELGDPSEMDGTVEIQNPMKLWQEAQAAQAARNAGAEVLDESGADFDLKTEIADPSRFRAFDEKKGDQASLHEQSDPTFLMPQPQTGADAFGDSSPGMDPSGLGSGVHPYAQNTPPGGRAPGPGGFPGQGSGFNNGAAFNRGHSPSGLHSAQLFEDSEAEQTSQQEQHDPRDYLHPSTAQPAGTQTDASHEGPWKLRTGFGLTYEFPDTRSLRNWLSSREDLEGYVVSADDGANFLELDSFPQFSRSSGRQSVPSGNFSMPTSHGSGLNRQPSSVRDASTSSGFDRAPDHVPAHASASQSATNRGPRVNTDYKPPSREAQYRGMLWGLFFLLLVIAVAIGLQTFGIFDIVGFYKSSNGPAVQAPQTEIAPVADPVDPEVLAREQAAATEKLLKDARREIEGNKLQSALEKLQTIVAVTSDNAEAYELLADVHARLGQADESEKADAKARELRGAEAPEAAPDAGQPSE